MIRVKINGVAVFENRKVYEKKKQCVNVAIGIISYRLMSNNKT